MTWPDDIAEGLPAPRDDEPQSLRQDIADELADHLQCAFRREAVKTPDEQLARKKVLGRFGNPHQIARQLWFDALKEKIMSQRIMLGLTVVLSLICLTATFMTWFVVSESRAATAVLMERTQAANAQLLQELARLSAGPTAPPPSLEWNPVKVRLVTPDRQGKIPAGMTVELSGNVLDSGKEAMVAGKIDDEGLVTFGLVRPGQHLLQIRTPWHEINRRTLTVRPGETSIEEIICPLAMPPETEIKVSVNWPDDLRDKNLWLVGDFGFVARRFGDKSWSWLKDGRANPPRSGGSRYITGERQLAITSDGLLIASENSSTLNSSIFSPQEPRPRGETRFPFQGRPDLPQDALLGLIYHSTINKLGVVTKYSHSFGMEKDPPVASVNWPAIEYVLRNIVVGTEVKDGESSKRKLQVNGAMLERFQSRDPQPLLAVLTPEDQPHFQAIAGQVNEWKITLPDELVKIVREQLVKGE